MNAKSPCIAAALTVAVLAVAAQSRTAAAADEPTATPAATGQAAPALRKIASSPAAERNIENFIQLQTEGVQGSLPNIKKYMAAEFVGSGGDDSIQRLMGKNVVARRVVKRDLFEKVSKNALSGIEGQKRVMEEIYGVGDEVIARWRITGVARGSLFGLEGKGQPIDITEIGFMRYDESGHLIEGYFQLDSAELLRQLGYNVAAPQ
jgi:SnoaL-like polyketide cyclase